MNRSNLFFVVVVAAGLSSACPQQVQDVGCVSDLDCSLSQRCEASRGLCLCIDDNACDAAEFCNLAGACQPKLECLNNGDCEGPSAMCDTTSGECVTLSASLQCVLDSQCPFGSFCDGQTCHTGCREDGDCSLGTPCIANQCDTTPGACSNNSFCEFGQLCNAQNRCGDHAERSLLCSECTSGDPTGDCPLNGCLIDQSVAPNPCTTDGECGNGSCLESPCRTNADCSQGTCEGAQFGGLIPGTCSQKSCGGFFCGGSGCDEATNPCPRGYFCAVLQVVSGSCTIGSGSAECGAPRNCNGGGENGAVGFCSCGQDSDCPGAGTTCVNPGPQGSCVVGTACAPSDGLLCEDLL